MTMILILMQLAKLARFAGEVWRDAQRLRRATSGPAEE